MCTSLYTNIVIPFENTNPFENPNNFRALKVHQKVSTCKINNGLLLVVYRNRVSRSQKAGLKEYNPDLYSPKAKKKVHGIKLSCERLSAKNKITFPLFVAI